MQNQDNDTKTQPLKTAPLAGRGSPGVRAMLLAAGLGTRLKPWTDAHPKALAVVNGKSLLQRNIEYLQQAGIRDVIVNVHHFAGQIMKAIDKNNGWGSNITISDETELVLETGGGLKKAAWYFKDAENFVLMNVDVLTDMHLGAMIAAHTQNKPLATLATTNRKTSRYFLFDDDNTLCGWRNVKTGEEKISRVSTRYNEKGFSGIHVINKQLLALMQQQGKFSMVDVYLALAKDNIIRSFDHSSSAFIDVGKPESVVEAEEMFG
jgi:NDP-sugar pyrophosphorylase family protein